MKLQRSSLILALVIIATLAVSMTTAKRGSRKSKKRDDPEPPSWKPNSNPAKGNSIFAKKAGMKIMLKCPADGNPKPRVKWLKDGAPIQKSSSGRVKERKFNLLMSDLQVSDQGNYTCEVENKFGRIDWTYTLRVIKVIWPLEVVGPQNATVYEGESVTFECRVLNDPQAQIQWLRRTLNFGNGKGDSKLESEKQMFIPTGENPERLILKDVKVADSGLYKCLVGNFNGLKYSDAWLTVYPKDDAKTTAAPKKKKDKVTNPPVMAEKTTDMKTKAPVTYTVPTTTEASKKRPGKDHKLPMVTDSPRQRRPKPTGKPNYSENGRVRGSKRKTISPLDSPLMTMAPPKTRPPKRKDSMKKKKEKPVFIEPDMKEKPLNTDKPDVYNMPTVSEEDGLNDEGQDKALADSESSPPARIKLWTVYIIVGAIAGGILLIGLVTLIVAVACAKREEGPYKSTTV